MNVNKIHLPLKATLFFVDSEALVSKLLQFYSEITKRQERREKYEIPGEEIRSILNLDDYSYSQIFVKQTLIHLFLESNEGFYWSRRC
jgi:hypothetical protein